jgi:hypothetical protein
MANKRMVFLKVKKQAPRYPMMEFLDADITPERQLWQGIKRGHVEAHRPKRFLQEPSPIRIASHT